MVTSVTAHGSGMVSAGLFAALGQATLNSLKYQTAEDKLLRTTRHCPRYKTTVRAIASRGSTPIGLDGLSGP